MANESFVLEKERPPRQGGRIDQNPPNIKNSEISVQIDGCRTSYTTFSLPAPLPCPFPWAWLPPCPFAVPPTLHS